MLKIESKHENAQNLACLLLKSSKLFINDHYGLHVLAPVYASIIFASIGKMKDNDKLIHSCFKITAQLVSLPFNFLGQDPSDKSQIEQAGVLIKKFNKIQGNITTFLEFSLKEMKLSVELQCFCLWLCALNTLQNRPIPQRIQFLKEIIQLCFLRKSEGDSSEGNSLPTMLVILDIAELFIFSHETEIGITRSKDLSVIMYHLIAIAEEGIPSEPAQYKKYVSKKISGYEKVICSIIQLCILIANLIEDAEKVKF